jgi:aryl-alcohol dehydrogenase-like predicted oxidoreductase
MRHLTLGHAGIALSRIVCGCWQAGKELWVGIRDEDSIAALRAAFDAGITTFDTAEDYGSGHSERILGQALGHCRDQIVIATKVSWNHLGRAQIIEACERSLRNLGTDRIDLYQIHWPAGTFGSERVPLAESMGALLDLKAQGKIRAIGVSNFSLDQLAEACRLGPVDSLQPPYSLFWRVVEKDLVPFCERAGIAILAYSPLAQGLLGGKLRAGHTFAPGDNRADNKLFQGQTFERALAAVEALRPLAARHGITVAQLALAWITARPTAAAIAGVRSPAQAVENAAAGDVTLSAADLAEMDRISRQVVDTAGENPVMWTWQT